MVDRKVNPTTFKIQVVDAETPSENCIAVATAAGSKKVELPVAQTVTEIETDRPITSTRDAVVWLKSKGIDAGSFQVAGCRTVTFDTEVKTTKRTTVKYSDGTPLD